MLYRSGDASSTLQTSKPSREWPGGFWRKRERATLKRTSRKHICSSPASQGRVSPPEHIQIGASPLPGRRRLHTLNLKEPYDIFPLPAACFSAPQIYVGQQPTPALYLSFELGFQGVPLAQNEAIDFLVGDLRAWGSSEQVADLAWGRLI